MGNYFNELRWKIIRANNLLQLIHQVTIEIRFRTRSLVRIRATYTNRFPSGGVSYVHFRHFVLLKKYIVYGQGPIAWL